MNWRKETPKKITIIIFAGFLIGPDLPSRKKSLYFGDVRQKELALKKAG
jgi:hypothetical protein